MPTRQCACSPSLASTTRLPPPPTVRTKPRCRSCRHLSTCRSQLPILPRRPSALSVLLCSHSFLFIHSSIRSFRCSRCRLIHHGRCVIHALATSRPCLALPSRSHTVRPPAHLLPLVGPHLPLCAPSRRHCRCSLPPPAPLLVIRTYLCAHAHPPAPCRTLHQPRPGSRVEARRVDLLVQRPAAIPIGDVSPQALPRTPPRMPDAQVPWAHRHGA